MSYTFDIVGVSPILNFFEYQQKLEQNSHRSTAYLGSYECTLDSFIQSSQMLPNKPDWNWDEVMQSMIKFWIRHEEGIRYWQNELEEFGDNHLIIARIANVQKLRYDLESLFNE